MFKINIRRESFGGTLFNLENGRRYYINNVELDNIMNNMIFPNDIPISENIKRNEIKLVENFNNLSNNHFSFMDIAFLEVTRKCNLYCKHCLNDSGKCLDNELSDQEIKKIIEKFAENGVQDIRFTGGEPLLNSHIYEYIKLATDNGIYASIGTNGTLITKEVAKKLKESGLKKAVISIDGSEKTHDSIRGEGNYLKAMDGVKNLIDEGVNVRINSVIMKSNMDDVIELAKEMHKKQIHIFLRRFIESGRGKNLKDNMLLSADYDYVREQLKEELKDKYVIGHYLKDASTKKSRIDLPFDIKGCKAGKRALAVMANGDIQLCGFLYSQGVKPVINIREIDDWIDFWNSIQIDDKLVDLKNSLDKYNQIPGIQKTYCLAYIQLMKNRGNL